MRHQATPVANTMQIPLHHSSRHGTALVIALILLAALLLLGLPFLVLQASSLHGSSAYAGARLAQLGRDNSTNLAIAVAADAFTPARTASPSGARPPAWESLSAHFLSPMSVLPTALRAELRSMPAAIHPMPAADGIAADADGSIAILPQQMGIGGLAPSQGSGSMRPSMLLGASISDESGKLDPNSLAPERWACLLAAVGIPDWTLAPSALPTTAQNPVVGQLAIALAHLRLALPGHRITDLAQLLSADPRTLPLPAGVLAGSGRRPLMRAELERLRPFLTLHTPRPGLGLIDLGSVVTIDAVRDNTLVDVADDPQHPLLGDGTVVLSEGSAGAPVSQDGGAALVDDPHNYGETATTLHLLCGHPLACATATFAAGSGEPNDAVVGSAVLIETPAPLNVHAIGVVVRAALNDGRHPIGRPFDAAPTAQSDDNIVSMVGSTLVHDSSSGAWISAPGTGLASTRMRLRANGMVASWNDFPWTEPLNFGDERPMLGIASSGIVSIDAHATALDAMGRPTAAADRSDTVQAVPQELLLERRWLTQGAFHQLVYGRFTSHMQAWPVAYERVATDATGSLPDSTATGTANTAGHPVLPDDVDLALQGSGAAPAAARDESTALPTA